jgi:hypothetical protein
VGFLTGLLTLPLAPVRGTVWIAEQLVVQAERELGDETTIRRQLIEVERQFDLGLLTVEEYEAVEDQLLERMEQLRDVRPPERALPDGD